MKVILNSNEVKLAKDIAVKRTQVNNENNIKNLTHADTLEKSIEYEFQGMAAEIAFCKLFNIYPDLSTSIRSSSFGKGRSTYDCTLPNGKTVDVKQTSHKNGHLITGTWKDSTDVSYYGDYFALMVGKSPEFELKGFLEQSELIRSDRLKDFGKGPTYAAKQGELKSYLDICSSKY